MKNTLITLAEFHYELGFIGYDEYRERVHVALWLSDELNGNDPRLDPTKDEIPNEQESFSSEDKAVVLKDSSGRKVSTANEDGWLEFLCLGVWVFTKADPDSYPSIPHGHYKSQNRPWPNRPLKITRLIRSFWRCAANETQQFPPLGQ